MTRNRRKYDNCLYRRIWEKFSPHIQSGAYLPVIGALATIIWAGFGFIRDTQAYAPQITAIQNIQEQMQNKQDSQQQTLAGMQQEVHDIHEFLLNGRGK